MTATEMRDRLDHRFKLLVRSRRGLERHQTLRQAVSWSYDLLEEPEKALLERCSVFAGGFDVQGARAVAGSEDADEFTILDLLDTLVRKSLLIADRSTGKTRFSMLETIRQFAEEKLVERGEAAEASSAHARISPTARPTSSRCGTARASGRRMPGSPPNSPICAPRSAGPPTAVTSTLPRPSRRAPGFSASSASRIMSRFRGQKS